MASVCAAPAEASDPVDFVPINVEPMRVASAAEPAMPTTATQLPELGLLGALLLSLAAGLDLTRRVRRLRSAISKGEPR